MIRSCKYCLSQTHLCPRCEGPVIVRTLTETVHGSIFSTSVILCTNLECQNYGSFKLQTIESIDVYICDECKKDESRREAHIEA